MKTNKRSTEYIEHVTESTQKIQHKGEESINYKEPVLDECIKSIFALGEHKV